MHSVALVVDDGTLRDPIRDAHGPARRRQPGLVAWERTIADVLSEAGYATACFGKWHLGAEDGRWPTDHGFDEWYGPPRSYDESRWDDNPWYRPDRDLRSYMHEGTRDGGVRQLDDEPLTMERRRDVDVEYKRRAIAFLERSVAESRPFYLYFNHSLLHVPTIPRAEFQGATGNGDWADCLAELDHDFGDLLDELDRLGVAEETIVVLAGDNGAENLLIARGSAGVFDGSYFTSSEGGLRTPCLIRWPGEIVPTGRRTRSSIRRTCSRRSSNGPRVPFRTIARSTASTSAPSSQGHRRP